MESTQKPGCCQVLILRNLSKEIERRKKAKSEMKKKKKNRGEKGKKFKGKLQKNKQIYKNSGHLTRIGL